MLSAVKRLIFPRNQNWNVYDQLAAGATVLDVGCSGFLQVRIAQQRKHEQVRHFGIDYCDRSAEAPPGYTFKLADLSRQGIPFETATFDLVAASHVLEHVSDPTRIFSECVRVCKPGGIVFIAAPSERSLFAPGMFFGHRHFVSLSFFDDPTHTTRPWTAQALYRLACCYGCEPHRVGYTVSGWCRAVAPILAAYALLKQDAVLFERVWWYTLGWECYAVIRKPSGAPEVPQFRYYFPAHAPSRDVRPAEPAVPPEDESVEQFQDASGLR